MSNLTIGLICLGIMIVLMFLEVPLGFAFIISGVIGLTWMLGPAMAVNYLKTVPYNTVASYSYAVMPLFMLMSDTCTKGKLTTNAYDAARKWLGRLPGGLAITTTVASGIFGAICGSMTVTSLIMPEMAWPEMKRHNYSPELGLGSIAAASPLAILIPPSTPLMVYGILTGTSVGSLFMAGWVPGIMLLVMMSIVTVVIVKLHPDWASKPQKFPLREKMKSLLGALPILILVVLVMICIWGGITTVIEAGGIGAAGALIICAIQRKLTLKQMAQTIRNTAMMAAGMFLLLIGIQVFNACVTFSGIPTFMGNWVTSLPLSPRAILWVIILVYLVLGCFIDGAPVTMICIPLFAPIVSALGFNPIWFGILTTMTSAIGAISPPVGICLFLVSSKVPDAGLNRIIKGAIPYLITMIIALIILFYVPDLSLWLPGLMQ
ncbi:MAG: TRAP transporter large permease [Parasporobacterium sp.]|nr:TRAP transporter large permease [Parasporobacterium sp.]